MVRLPQERILLIGDAQHDMEAALRVAVPRAALTSVSDYFEGIAELRANNYTAVVAATEPIERRPEAAVRTLRELAGGSRLILFGYPALEAISRKMLEFGCDDYVVTPARPAELLQMFGAPVMRIAPESPSASGVSSDVAEPPSAEAPEPVAVLQELPLADIMLDALLQHPGAAMAASVQQVNARIAPSMRLTYQPRTKEPRQIGALEGGTLLTHAVRIANEEIGHLYLSVPGGENPPARHFLTHFAHLAAKVYMLQDQHTRLQKLAITDELTGVFNRRYFKHFLSTILERARIKRFWVTLLLFDIDNFKKYNDQYGHTQGDEILRETATLMKRCVREHDLVARIGGDEFAVVFWDKEGPRQPKDPTKAASSRPPQEPQEPEQIFERFKRLIASRDFPGLGPTGQGVLTISGGLSNYPWDGRDMDELITAADNKLMFKAKKEGKNSILLVGREDQPGPVPPPQ